MTLPQTMRAARIAKYGAPSVFEIQDVPLPVVGDDDILIKVYASSVNPIDCKMRSGSNRAVVRRTLPTTLGMDVSGEVVAKGKHVQAFEIGDEVYSSPDHLRDGTYAQYVVVSAKQAAHKPKNMSHEEAASIPLVGLTAWDCLVGHANIQPEQRVLIQAGSGGVGSFAIQLARAKGANVLTTCSGRNVDLVSSLGAQQVIDYTQQSIEDSVDTPLDACLDAINDQPSTLQMIKACKSGGYVSSITSGLPESVKTYGAYVGVVAVGLNMGKRMLNAKMCHRVNFKPVVRTPSGENLDKITALIEQGAIKAVIDRVYPLEEIEQAHQYSETGRARGKIVIRVEH